MDAHSFWTFLLCVSTLTNCVTTLHAHLIMRYPCIVLFVAASDYTKYSFIKMIIRHPRNILVPASTCLLYRSPSFVSIYGLFPESFFFSEICHPTSVLGSIFSQIAMAAERYRASSNLSNYEYTNRNTGHLLNIAHVWPFQFNFRPSIL